MAKRRYRKRVKLDPSVAAPVEKRLRELARLEKAVQLELDRCVRDAVDMGMTYIAVGKAIGTSDTAVKKRGERGWIRTGPNGRPREKGTP